MQNLAVTVLLHAELQSGVKVRHGQHRNQGMMKGRRQKAQFIIFRSVC